MGTEHFSSKESTASDRGSGAREQASDYVQRLDPEGQVLPTRASLLSLQRTIGNRAVQRLLLSRQVVDRFPQGLANPAVSRLVQSRGAATTPTATITDAPSLVVGGKGATTEDERVDRQLAPATGGKGAATADRWVYRQAIDAFQRQNPEGGIVTHQRQLLGPVGAAAIETKDYSPTIRRKGKADATAGGGAPALTKKTVKGPTSKDYGGFSWTVQWELDKPSPKGGLIVQGVNAVHTITKKDGSKVGTPGFDAWVPYWEAWQVNKGQKITTYAQKGDVMDDQFQKSPSAADTQGTFEEIGTAAFHEGLKLPSSMKPNPKSPAGILPFTQSDPGLTGGSATLAHSLKAVWDGVGGDGSTTVTTV